MSPDQTPEGARLAGPDAAAWRRWGPYLSERQWGTVREDYSADGDAWGYFPHDHARRRAYRWGEDGLAGFSDDRLRIALSLALWNGRDPILKERLFGLTNAEGNHGEDVKELYYHLDGVPSHAYQRMLYKYPQAAFPYEALVAGNARRGVHEREYELADTGVFESGRYFDVEVEYAKADVDDLVMRIVVTNRGPDRAAIDVLPQVFARNTWSWTPGIEKPRLAVDGPSTVRVDHPDLPPLTLHCEGAPTLLVCENETNPSCFGRPGEPGRTYKDGIGERVVGGRHEAVAAGGVGTKVAAWYHLELAGGDSAELCVSLGPTAHALPAGPWREIVAARRREADDFYAALQNDIADADERAVQRQAFAGLTWSKQYYEFDIRRWLAGDPLQPPPPPERRTGRDVDWQHLANADIIAMPDTWEYPWYASWDLGFHAVTWALIDPAFAKAQLVLLTQSRFQHPNGQLPAYEWSFGDANPPVQAWAALQIYEADRRRTGVGDTQFLERVFHKLLLSFTWWVNRQDSSGRNIFQGGFLGLDNVGLFDRNHPPPGGGTVDQSDGTAWVSSFALNLMRIALELARQAPVYEDLATKFFEHFLFIAEAVHETCGAHGTGLWDETDGFYYDVLRRPDAPDVELRVRSVVGLIPLLAVEVLQNEIIETLPAFRARMRWFLDARPELARLVSHVDDLNRHDFRMLSLMRRHRLKRVLARLLDEAEFLSPFGIRSLSRVHEEHPATFDDGAMKFTVRYTPGEGASRDFGGNSNWRGPVWFPVNLLILQALRRYHTFYGDDFQVDFPSGSGRTLTLDRIADALGDRLLSLFRRGPDGRRPCFGDDDRQQHDPHFRDHLLFHEFFDPETGRGCGASHQTGWTAAVALLLPPEAQRRVAEASAEAPGATNTPPAPPLDA